jgi:hypothetical protein
METGLPQIATVAGRTCWRSVCRNGANGKAEVGVLNEGIIGNRLLADSPLQAAGGRFGAVLGQGGLVRFERDVLSGTGVKFVILGLGINDIAFPGSKKRIIRCSPRPNIGSAKGSLGQIEEAKARGITDHLCCLHSS